MYFFSAFLVLKRALLILGEICRDLAFVWNGIESSFCLEMIEKKQFLERKALKMQQIVKKMQKKNNFFNI